MKTVIVLAHPRGLQTLCGAIASEFETGATASGVDVELIDLASLDFDCHLRHSSPNEQPLEPGLLAVKDAINSADHVVFVYPTWWGTFPALLKGMLDRVFTPGWAFREIEGGTGYQGLLGGRTAELITTMDTPGLVYSLVYGAPGRNALGKATLDFCGFDVVRHTRFGTVRDSNAADRIKWLAQARDLGARLHRGPLTLSQRVWRRVSPWLQALRLQFYPMTFIAYWLGAAIHTGPIDWRVFALGYAVLFALEAATVFINDLVDAPSDRDNRFWGPFNGGSRVIQEGKLTPSALYVGTGTASALSAIGFACLVWLAGFSAGFVATYGLLAVLAIGYTLPPLKLSWRGLGEIDVALTHSLLVMLAGLSAQGGAITTAEAWLFGAPLLLSILPSIILSGIPDHSADQAVGKQTIAVRTGVANAFRISGILAIAAAVSMLVVGYGSLPGSYGSLVPAIVAVHAAWIARSCFQEASRPASARRIDTLMIATLSFILWFCVVPLVLWQD